MPWLLQTFLIQGYCYACIALQNCLNESAIREVEKYAGWHHNVILSWDHLGYIWKEKALKDAGEPSAVQAAHYDTLRQLKPKWPPSLQV